MSEIDFIGADQPAIEVAESYRCRKQTAVLAIVFADIANSTQQREELGEVRYEELREEFEREFGRIICMGDAGVVVKGTGDGALAVFSEPSTAVERCLEVQRALAKHPFKLRLGVDMGQVSVKSSFGIVADVFGRQVNRAARIESLAEAGHILTSFHVYDCAFGWLREKNVQWHNHGTHELKGFAEPTSIHEVFDPRTTSPQDLRASRVVTFHSRALVESPMFARSRREDGPLPRYRKRKPDTRDWAAIYQSLKADPPKIAGPVLGEGTDSLKDLADAIKYSARCVADLIEDRPAILWVDDHPENNHHEHRLLKQAGIRVDSATSTSAAQAKIDATNYLLVITDMVRTGAPTAGLDLIDWLTTHVRPAPVYLYASPNAVWAHAEAAREKGCLLATAGLITLLAGIKQLLDAYESKITAITRTVVDDVADPTTEQRDGWLARALKHIRGK